MQRYLSPELLKDDQLKLTDEEKKKRMSPDVRAARTIKIHFDQVNNTFNQMIEYTKETDL